MSIKLMSQVWEMADVTGSELLVLLALADYGNDEGGSIYPSMTSIAKKARLSVDQARRVIHKLTALGIVELVEQGGWTGTRNRSNEYKIRVDVLVNCKRGTRVDTRGVLADCKDGTSVDASTVLAPVQDDPLLEPSLNQTEEEEETHAHDPLVIAWQQAYTGVEMPTKLAASLRELVAECGMAATIHGIKASAVKEGGRNFRYIAECARNYVPPAPMASYANGNPYTIDIPGIVELPALKQTAPVLPPPMAHDDPWTIALAELSAVLPGSAPRWLQGSSLKENGELAGVPFYRVTLVCPEADPGWLRQQAEPAIRKKLASLLGKRITLEIVNPHREYAA